MAFTVAHLDLRNKGLGIWVSGSGLRMADYGDHNRVALLGRSLPCAGLQERQEFLQITGFDLPQKQPPTEKARVYQTLTPP